MGDHQGFERYYWFDREVQAGNFPNAPKLAAAFEISSKTAQRAIDFMRDRIGAPLEYDKTRKGFYYADSTFQFPSLHISQEELLSILMARNLLSHSAGGAISDEINKFGKRLFLMLGTLGIDENRMKELFSATWTEYAPAQRVVFQTATKAILNSRTLLFSYSSPTRQHSTFRAVEPHHLQHYMGSWTMIAFCHVRNEWRRFMLSRMSDIKLGSETFTPQPKTCWRHKLEGAFGLFQGGPLQPVKLLFNRFRAPWIKEQVWHPNQVVTPFQDGSVILSFPVSDFPEVKMKILQFGSDVEVLEPVELRLQITEEIMKMRKLYT